MLIWVSASVSRLDMDTENETGLTDDINDFSERISGTLTFSDDDVARAEEVENINSDSRCSACASGL